MNRAFFAAAGFSFFVACSTAAFAQDEEVAPSTPPPATATLSDSPAPAAAPPADERRGDEKKDSAHFRFGLGLDGDFFLSPGPSSLQGLGAGVQVRLGVQINSWFATYYQAHAVFGGTIQGSGLATNATLIGAVFNSALVEATLPVLHIGAGPSVDILGVDGFSLSGRTSSLSPAFGLDGRAAIVIGGHGPGRHGGFDIEANVHPTFWNGIVLTTLSLGIGGEMY